MNAVGKILVVLNFLFAVVVGGFLVVDFATRSDWKTAYKTLERQVKVLEADRDTAVESMTGLANEKKNAEAERDQVKKKAADDAAEAKVVKLNLEQEVEDKKLLADDRKISLDKATSELERIKVSEATLRKIVKEREDIIARLQDEKAKLTVTAVASEQKASNLAERLQQVGEELQKQLAENEKLRLKGGATGASNTPTIKSGINALNPPSTLVKGKVEKVDATDKTLVEISLGTDQGVNKNNTLEVFRTSPEPKYLGVIRIVDANFNKSVGRLIVPPGTTVRPQLQVGDSAWSYLTRD